MDIPDDWLPTAANVNALPAPLRRYIHDIETMCDPSFTQQQLICLGDQVRDLTSAFLELKGGPAAKGDTLTKVDHERADQAHVSRTSERKR